MEKDGRYTSIPFSAKAAAARKQPAAEKPVTVRQPVTAGICSGACRKRRDKTGGRVFAAGAGPQVRSLGVGKLPQLAFRNDG